LLHVPPCVTELSIHPAKTTVEHVEYTSVLIGVNKLPSILIVVVPVRPVSDQPVCVPSLTPVLVVNKALTVGPVDPVCV